LNFSPARHAAIPLVRVMPKHCSKRHKSWRHAAKSRSIPASFLYHYISPGRYPAQTRNLLLLQRKVRAAQTMRVLVPDAGKIAWHWRPDDPDTVTHRIAFAAADLITSPALGRVHVCPGDNCAWLFLDKSRPGRRVWCSEETCGTRDRVRRWRIRRQRA
jgi:predicted RNA-binding Zn ribbon-like protein